MNRKREGGLMRTIALIVLMMGSVVAGVEKPASRPATQPTLQMLQANLDVAKKSVAYEKSRAMDKIKLTPKYKSLSEAARSAKFRADAARKSRSPAVDKLKDAASAADDRLNEETDRQLEADKKYVAAVDRLSDAEKAVKSLAKRDPISAAILDHEIVVGMTMKQAEEATGDSGELTSESEDSKGYSFRSRFETMTGGVRGVPTFDVTVRDGKITNLLRFVDRRNSVDR